MKNSRCRSAETATRRMFVSLLLLSLLSLPLSSSSHVAADEPTSIQVSLLATKDAYIQHDYPYFDPFHHPSKYNYGASPFLLTASGGQSNHPRSLVQFDLSSIPQNAQVLSAELKLYCYSGGTSQSIGCYPLEHSWVEGTMNQKKDPPREIADGCTWNTYDGINSWTSAGGDYDQSALLDEIHISNNNDQGWKAWNVSAAVQSRINQARPDYGFLLVTLGYSSYWGASFYSKDYSDLQYWPRLEIEYDVQEEPLVQNLAVSPGTLDPYDQESDVEISYELKEESLIQIEIYNPDGEKVKALFEDLDDDGAEIERPEEQAAGHHSSRWCGVIDFPEIAVANGDKGVLLAPDGEYTVKVIATSLESERTDCAEAEVEVESE